MAEIVLFVGCIINKEIVGDLSGVISRLMILFLLRWMRNCIGVAL
jgi:hypothetical protein